MSTKLAEDESKTDLAAATAGVPTQGHENDGDEAAPLNSDNKIDNDKQALVTKLNRHDVLMGRGANIAEYEGNSRLRRLVSERRSDYMAAPKRMGKHRVAEEVVDTILQRGGRFLRRMEDETALESKRHAAADTEVYTPVTDKAKLLPKIKQLLRDIGPESRLKRAERRRERKRLRDVWPLPDKEFKAEHKPTVNEEDTPTVKKHKPTVNEDKPKSPGPSLASASSQPLQAPGAPVLFVSPFSVLPAQAPPPPAAGWSNLCAPQVTLGPPPATTGPPVIIRRILPPGSSLPYPPVETHYPQAPLPQYPSIQVFKIIPPPREPTDIAHTKHEEAVAHFHSD